MFALSYVVLGLPEVVQIAEGKVLCLQLRGVALYAILLNEPAVSPGTRVLELSQVVVFCSVG